MNRAHGPEGAASSRGIGPRVQAARRANGKGRGAIAAVSGISLYRVAQIEAGRGAAPSRREVRRLARAISVGEFVLTGEQPPEVA